MPRGNGRKRGSSAYNPIDVHVGDRLRTRRTLLWLSQSTLAEAIGLTFQQMQKYEKGSNRISASRLYDLAQLLDVSASTVRRDLEQLGSKGVVKRTHGGAIFLGEDAEPAAPVESQQTGQALTVRMAVSQ